MKVIPGNRQAEVWDEVWIPIREKFSDASGLSFGRLWCRGVVRVEITAKEAK